VDGVSRTDPPMWFREEVLAENGQSYVSRSASQRIAASPAPSSPRRRRAALGTRVAGGCPPMPVWSRWWL